MVIQSTYADGKVTGTRSTNGQDKPIATDPGGAAFAEGVGAPFEIGCLPLKDGYTASFRNFDPQKQKLKLLTATVAESEKVTVPGGCFDVYRVDVTNADDPAEKATYWIDKASRKPVKLAAVLPSMGGAKLSAELQ